MPYHGPSAWWLPTCRKEKGQRGSQMETQSSLPHGVQQGAILRDPQEFVGHGHVVCHWLLSIMEKGIWSPDLTCH